MSLDLDERQRAMLQEMQLRVWWPRAEPAPVSLGAAAPAPRVAAPVATRPAARVMPVRQADTVTAAPEPVRRDSVSPPAGDIDSMDWPDLAHAISTCRACRLCEGRKAPVFTPEAAPRQVDWLVVGEPPDAEEDRAGVPFVGQSGQLLDNMLRAVQVSRHGTGSVGARLTPVVKCRPAAVRNPLADELATCAHYLRREITLAQPKVILAMGRFAAQSLLGPGHPELAGVPFGKLRGQVHRFHGVAVVVTYHPTRLLRAQEDKARAWADLCLAQSLARPVAY